MTRRKMNDGYYMPRLYDFLSCLRDNNYREWFKANKAEYDDLRAAWIEDIDRMIVLMGRWEPAIAMANSGKTASYRIYRDTRFSQDKTPFKTYFSASVSTRGRAPHYGGYYIEAGPGSFGGNADTGLFGGMWCPEPAVLKKIRKAIVDNIEEFEGIISAPALQREFPGWCGSSLKTVPKGYDRNHPHICFVSRISVNSIRAEPIFSLTLRGLRRAPSCSVYLSHLSTSSIIRPRRRFERAYPRVF